MSSPSPTDPRPGRAPIRLVPVLAIAGSVLGLGAGSAWIGTTVAGPVSVGVEATPGDALDTDPAPVMSSMGGFERAVETAGPVAARMTRAAVRSDDLECLTQAAYYEARGEGRDGMRAVAQVVLNRARHGAFPGSVCGVVFQGSERRVGCQFSFTCNGSMRGGVNRAAWNRARAVAKAALRGETYAPVGSATHFHTTAVAPVWRHSLVRVGQVGDHLFYRLGRGGPNRTEGPTRAIEAAPRTARGGMASEAASGPVPYTLAIARDATPGEVEVAPTDAAAPPASVTAETEIQPAAT